MKAELSKTKRTKDISGLLIWRGEDTAADDYKSGPHFWSFHSFNPEFSRLFFRRWLLVFQQQEESQQPVQFENGGMESGAARQEEGVKVCQASPELSFSAEQDKQLLLV